MRVVFLVLIALSVFAAGSCFGAGAAPQPGMDRTQWHYQVPAGVRRIVDQGEKRWLLHFPNGTTNVLQELSRTDRYVELRNESNRNVLRLFDRHGMIRSADGTTFRRFTEGRWIQEAADGASTVGPPSYQVNLVYFVPSDREPTANYEAKIRVIAELMEEVVANDLRAKGLNTIGPRFHRREGQIVVDLIRGQRESRIYNQNGAWKSNAHADEIFVEVTAASGRELLVSGPLTGKEQTVRLPLDSSILGGANSSLQALVVDGGGNFAKVVKKPQS